MTNEKYLYISYFAVALAGLTVAVVVALILGKPLRRMLAAVSWSAWGTLLQRVFPAWLILTVLLGFISVSYFDCHHSGYADVIRDRSYLIQKNQDQATTMLYYLLGVLVLYSCLMPLFLWSNIRRHYHNDKNLKENHL